MAEQFASGRCLCGKLSYRVTGPAVWSGYCHCSSCRRFTGSVVTNWLGISEEHLEFDGDTPACYRDGGVTRGFCPDCGSSLTHASERFPGYVQLHLGSLDEPGRVRPLAHVHHGEKIGWFEIDDELPRFEASAADAGENWDSP
jgi:hypothetical protein